MVIFTVGDMPPVGLSIAPPGEIEAQAEPVVYVNTGEPYGGPYEFTPTNTIQTAEVSGLMATEDIIINPIPNNYGLITWNGATLTVS